MVGFHQISDDLRLKPFCQRSLLMPGKAQDAGLSGCFSAAREPSVRGRGDEVDDAEQWETGARTRTHARMQTRSQTTGSSIISNPVLLLVLGAAANPELDFAVSVFTSAEAAR